MTSYMSHDVMILRAVLYENEVSKQKAAFTNVATMYDIDHVTWLMTHY